MASELPKPNEFVAPTLEELKPLFPAYELEAFIAQGGMGAVYKATQKSLDRPVAIKILPAEFGADPQFRASFEAEAKAMARLNHPNLIAVYDFGDVEGMLYIVMEFVHGKALYYSSHKKAIDPPVALDLVSTICRGLGHAHRGGIIHRDIKPANILLDTDARPKIGDFGLAHSIDRGRDEGLVFGTPGYTAPEIFIENAEVDARSDIFSVGALLYELISGTRPEPHAHSLSTGTDHRIDAIIKKATHSSPALRYPSVDQLADALDGLLPKLSGPKFATAPRASGPPNSPTTTLASNKQRSGAFSFFLLLFILVAGAGAAFLILGDPTEKPSAPASTNTPPVSKSPSSDRAKQNKKGNQREGKERDRRKKPADREKAKPAPEKDKPSPPDPRKNKRPPLEVLTQLAPDLRDGRREEFPPTTFKDDRSAFFLVSKKLTWDQAHQFATEHGARLAVLPTSESLAKIQDHFPCETPVWLGASDSGFEKMWHWTDGTAVSADLWAPGSPDNRTNDLPAGEDFAALSSEKPLLEDHQRLKMLPCLLEWQLDGSTPSALEEQLSRTARALANRKTPVFPAGTDNVGGSRFLLVKREIPWDQAAELADSGGGHLAVPSNASEASFLALTLKEALRDDHCCWIGGQRKPGTPEIWQFVTGESFTFIKWLEGEPDNFNENENYLAIERKEDQIGASDESQRGHQNSHLLIEWSVPSLRNMPTAAALAADQERLLKALEKIRDQIRDEHQRDYRKYRKERDEIIEDFVENTITHINNQERLPAPVKARLVEEVKKYREEDRLPKDLPRPTPRKIQDDLEEAREDLKELQDDYQEDYEEAMQDYLDELIDQSKEVLKEGEQAKAEIFILESNVTGNDDKRFKEILDGEKVPLPAKPQEEKKDDEND